MPVASGEAVSVIEDQEIPVSCFSFTIDDYTVGRSMDLCIVQSGNVQAEVHFGVAIERIGAIPVMARDSSFNRPNAWSMQECVGSLLSDFFQQRQMAFHIGRAVLQKIDSLLQIGGTKQFGRGVIDLRAANRRAVQFAAFYRIVALDEGLNL